MRGTSRYFRTFALLLSLVIGMAVGVLWVRSHWGHGELLFPKAGAWGWALLSEHGTLALRNYGEVDPTTGTASIATAVPPLISIPHYVVVLMCAALPIALFLPQQRRRMRHRGFPMIERDAGPLGATANPPMQPTGDGGKV